MWIPAVHGRVRSDTKMVRELSERHRPVHQVGAIGTDGPTQAVRALSQKRLANYCLQDVVHSSDALDAPVLVHEHCEVGLSLAETIQSL